MTWPKSTVPSLELPNRTLPILNPLLVQSLRTLSESGKKLPRSAATSAISWQDLTGVLLRYRTLFKNNLEFYKLNWEKENLLLRLSQH